MALKKFSSVDGFVVVDLDAATASVGPLRLAPKVLQADARALARSATYKAALLQRDVSGAGGGISAAPDAADESWDKFAAEAASPAVAGFVPMAGWGVSDARAADLRTALGGAGMADTAELVGAGVAAAARAFHPGLSTVALVNVTPASLAAARRLVESGVKVIAASSAKGSIADGGGLSLDGVTDRLKSATEPAGAALEAEADVLIVTGRNGSVDHEAAAAVKARCIVPATDLQVTPRALAELSRRGVTVVCDALSTVGDVLGALSPTDRDLADAEAEIVTVVERVAGAAEGNPDGAFLTACKLAEEHLRAWTTPPFGRPRP